MIEFDGFSFWYPGAADPALADVDLTISEGELALVAGLTGSGKSTLLRAVNGLVPHFSGGHVVGRVVADGLESRHLPPREFAETVGFVGQDPLSGFVTEVVEDELAYGMEQLAIAPAVMRRRVEEVLDLMGIARLRSRSLRTLSGGEQQRVAIGSVLATNPRVLVLDEPTSGLDPAAAEDALAAVLRLVHDLGVTALVAEHRLERVVEYADRLVLVQDGRVRAGKPAELLVDSPVAPPVVQLGRIAGWSPPPLSVRDARRVARSLRDQLVGLKPASPAGPTGDPKQGLVARAITVRYGSTVAVRRVDLVAPPGEVIALMGRNGSGKSSLLWAIRGAVRRASGSVSIAGSDPVESSQRQAASAVALVPQQATDLLYRESVAAECGAADELAGVTSGKTRNLLDRIAGSGVVPDHAHPRDLSEGQRLALALAVQLSAEPKVILLDEPTRGLDYAAKARLRAVLADLAASDCGIVIATHDVEFVAQTAQRVVVLAEGEVVTSAPTAEALAGSPVFAPQVAKVLGPDPWLTTEQVAAALSPSTADLSMQSGQSS